jgi:hypothetical protein
MDAVMTTRPTRPMERRKTERHRRCLRVAWRVLGNRHLSFREAPLKDVGSDGLALQVDEVCLQGAVVVVQFEGAGEVLGQPLLMRACWCSELTTGGSGMPAYLLGCSFTSPLAERELGALLATVENAASPPPEQEPLAKSAARLDACLFHGTREKRTLVRRGGFAIRVALCANEGKPVEACVVDRSPQGVGILVKHAFRRGTMVTIKPSDVPGGGYSVEVEVCNSRRKGNQWIHGCRFLQAPAASVLSQLGWNSGQSTFAWHP